MSIVSRFSLLVAMLALVTMADLGSPGRAGPELSNPKIRIKVLDNDGGYRRPKTVKYEALRTKLMKRAVLEEFVQFLSPIRLPQTLWLLASECAKDGPSPHYNPNEHWINMCYEFLESIEEQARQFADIAARDPTALPMNISREEAMDGLYVAVLLHEAAHALFDLLDIPVFGREEDAADAMAAFIALQFDSKTARTVIKGAASIWMLHNNPPTKAMDPREPNYPKDEATRCQIDPFCRYSDEHGTSGQRLYNLLCIAYGGNPAVFQDFVDLKWLPPQRAAGCKGEYEQIRHSFEKTVYPFVDRDMMKRVQSIQWMKPGSP
jgi:hypothetical protein